jgi:hypothetical protein
MPEYVIEREIPGAGQMTEEEIRAESLRSLEVLKRLGPQIQCTRGGQESATSIGPSAIP